MTVYAWANNGRIHILGQRTGFSVCMMPTANLVNVGDAVPSDKPYAFCASCQTLKNSQTKGIVRINKVASLKKRRAAQWRAARLKILPAKAWNELRYNALKNSDGKCCLCGRGKEQGVILHVDHIKPVSKYPKLAKDPKNLQVLCKECNLGKSNKDQTDWRPQG